MSGQDPHQRQNQAGPAIGPILGASVVTRSLGAVLPHYLEAGFQRCPAAPEWGRLPPVLEQSCTGRAWLAGGSRRPWLQLLEIPSAIAVDRYRHTGWFSLEVGSSEIEALAAVLARCQGFEILAGPAPLAVSDDIVATQVIGPSGEMYYFTQIMRPLPPFALPQPRHPLDELFIAVATSLDRDAALEFWQSLNGTRGLSLDTRIGVLNRGLGLDSEHRLPVGVAQLAGSTLIEIDQVPAVAARPALARGIAMISIAAEKHAHLQGRDEEWLELVAGTGGPSPQPRR